MPAAACRNAPSRKTDHATENSGFANVAEGAGLNFVCARFCFGLSFMMEVNVEGLHVCGDVAQMFAGENNK